MKTNVPSRNFKVSLARLVLQGSEAISKYIDI